MLRDVRFAIRSLARTRGLTVAALVCLALGIAAITVVFSATNALVLHPVPTSNSRGLVMLAELGPRPDADDDAIAPANYLDVRRMSRTLEKTAAFMSWDVNITGIEDPERVSGVRVSPELFSVLGERPMLGRTFTDREALTGAAPVVVLSEPLWRRRFGSDPSIVGSTVQLNGATHTIVGVMKADFIFPVGAELWAPLPLDGALGRERDGRLLSAIGRLKPGVSIDAARAEVVTIAKQLEAAYPEYNRKWSMSVESANGFYARHSRPFLLMELGAVAFVLLIACANVSNLLVARAVMRGREIAVRVALGASRRQLIRAHMIESGLLAFAGGALGVLLAVWGVTLMRGVLPAELVRYNPGWTRMGVDTRTLLFTLGVCAATALLVGVAPALVASRVDPQNALKEASRGNSSGGGRRLRNVLVGAEVALALVNVVGTGLMVRNFRELVRSNPGYRADHALTMTLTLPKSRYAADSDVARGFTQIVDRVRQVPGVEGVALANSLPSAWADRHTRFYLEGQQRPQLGEAGLTARYRSVSPSFFATMNIAVRRGRLFASSDRSDSPEVAVVSEAMAQKYWPGEDAIGKRFIILGATTPSTVIGIVGDVRANPNVAANALESTFYLPLTQAPYWRTMSLVVRTAPDPSSMTRDIQRAIGDVDHSLAAGDVLTLQHVLDSSLSPQRVGAGLLAIFSLIALMLAATGIYGVTSYAVSQRTHEIGLRIALGAQQRDVMGHVVRGAMLPVACGLAIGLGGALAVTRVMSAVVHEVSTSDPLSFAVALVVIGGVSVFGSYMPARRAARVDPIVALRSE